MTIYFNNITIPHLINYKANECELFLTFDNNISEKDINTICKSIGGPYNYSYFDSEKNALIGLGEYNMSHSTIRVE